MSSPSYVVKNVMPVISPLHFYDDTNGHLFEDVHALHRAVRMLLMERQAEETDSSSVDNNNGSGVIWLVGDSILDNKRRVISNSFNASPCNGYERIFVGDTTGLIVEDVAFCINKLLSLKSEKRWICINTAVANTGFQSHLDCISSIPSSSSPFSSPVSSPASSPVMGMMMMDDYERIYQDRFVQKHLEENDIVIVALGFDELLFEMIAGDDVSSWWIRNHAEIENILDGTAFGMEPLIEHVRSSLENLITLITQNTIPRLVILCGIPFLSSSNKKYDAIMMSLFRHAICHVCIRDVKIFYLPLFEFDSMNIALSVVDVIVSTK